MSRCAGTTGFCRRLVMLVLCAGALVAGCTPVPSAFARLDSAVTRDKFTNNPSKSDVRVVRDDVVLSPSVSMALKKGDSISTSSSAQIVMTFAAGYEVTLDTGTAIYIENPSIFLKWGRAFIRRLTGTPDTLDTHTRHATLHDVGTSYVVSVTPEVTTVRVETGVVAARMRGDSSPWTEYGALEGGQIRVGQRPTRTARISADQMEQELRWVRRIDQISNIVVPQLDSMTERDARSALDRAGLRVLFVTHRTTGRYAPGRVIESTPGAGQKTKPGTYVNLVLEKAAARDTQARQCRVPTITDMPEKTALALLARANLRGEAISRVGERDIVTTQQEKSGTMIACGSVVHYTWGQLR